MGLPRGEADTGRSTTARERTTAEMERRQGGQDSQVSSDRDRGEHHGDSQGESDDASEVRSGGSGGDSEEETEEDGMTKGEQGGSGDMLTASP